jgi:OOP family OmpA-OmpF porin
LLLCEFFATKRVGARKQGPEKERRLVLRHGIFAILLAATGAACLHLGERGAMAFERLLLDRVENGLAVLDIDWAQVSADGLRMELRGHAPDLFARDLALESARATASIAVVIDYTTVSLAPPPYREPVAVEILRDERGLTLTGRFYGEEMRSGMIAALAASAPGLEVHDLTGINAARPGKNWGPEPSIAALAAARVPSAYVRFQPGAVQVGGLVRDAAHRDAVSRELLALAGETIQLSLQLREPLVVAVPFALAVYKDASGGMRLEACSARNAEEEAVIEAALNRLAVARGDYSCPAALGGPSGDWAAAAIAGLEALERLPAGRFRLEYHTAELLAVAPADAEALEAALKGLAGALPENYVLMGGFGAGQGQEGVANDVPLYWLRFSSESGVVALGGVVPDEAARRVITTYAAARFGQAALRPALILAAADQDGAREPAGWEAAALVALDALNGVADGVAEVSPGRIGLSGAISDPVAGGELHRLMEGEAPEGYAVTTALRVDLPAQVAAAPLSARRCAVVLGAAVKEMPIVFAPGSAVFEAGSSEALDRLRDIFRRCDSGRIEVGGHTDSQGSQKLNQRLSRARAEAVVDALIARGVPLDRLAAQGYGEGRPVASNETEQGRAMNRRIEFVVTD